MNVVHKCVNNHILHKKKTYKTNKQVSYQAIVQAKLTVYSKNINTKDKL